MRSLDLTTAGLRAAIAVPVLCLLAACAGAPGAASSTAATAEAASPAPDYLTASDHFAALQSAGLSASYAEFARHLKAADAKTVTDALQRSFRGGPFDVYTRKSAETDGAYRRVVELRSTSGRLHLFVTLDRVSRGWVVSGYELDRRRDAVLARL